MKDAAMKRRPAYRDGVKMWTEGEVFTAPGGEIVEILYTKELGGERKYFAELTGIPACAHGDSIEEAIADARSKREDLTPLTDAERAEYTAENFRFSVSLLRRITRACRSGTQAWLKERGLGSDVTMTIKEFREAGGGQWADELESRLK